MVNISLYKFMIHYSINCFHFKTQYIVNALWIILYVIQTIWFNYQFTICWYLSFINIMFYYSIKLWLLICHSYYNIRYWSNFILKFKSPLGFCTFAMHWFVMLNAFYYIHHKSFGHYDVNGSPRHLHLATFYIWIFH